MRRRARRIQSAQTKAAPAAAVPPLLERSVFRFRVKRKHFRIFPVQFTDDPAHRQSSTAGSGKDWIDVAPHRDRPDRGQELQHKTAGDFAHLPVADRISGIAGAECADGDSNRVCCFWTHSMKMEVVAPVQSLVKVPADHAGSGQNRQNEPVWAIFGQYSPRDEN